MYVSELKRAIAKKAVDTLIKNNMKIGLGSGSTALGAVLRISERLKEGSLSNILLILTSFQTEVECMRLGLHLRSLSDPAIDGKLDITIDGADEVNSHLFLTKGGGGALLLEKIVAYASLRYAVMIEQRKLVKYLGQKLPLPVEIVPEALTTAAQRLELLGAKTNLRMAKVNAGPIITDHGNFILDANFKQQYDPIKMDQEIMMIPGVIANGIFTRHVDHLFIGYDNGRVEHRHSL